MGETKIPSEEQQQQCDARRDAPQRGLLAGLILALFGHLSGLLLRLLGATWRVEVLGDDPRRTQGRAAEDTGPRPHLAAMFHESMLPSVWCFRDRDYCVAVSRSRDGDLIQSTLIALGYSEPARGSSSRGGSAALLGLLRRFTAGTTVAVLVDGPRGPARVAKTGIISLARLAGARIQPVAFSARPAIRLKSWDQSLIPLPFARVICAFGEPMEVADEADERLEQAASRQLDERLVALHHAADRRLLPGTPA